MKLTKRFSAIVSLCEKVDIVVDVATDHGTVPIYIANENIAKEVIATDINEGPLNKCIENKNKYLTNKNVDFRTVLCDGLKGIEKCTNGRSRTIIITGIGCELMMDILADINEYDFEYLILCVHSKTYEFRKYLQNKGLAIIDEKIVFENGQYYFIEKCKKDNLNIEFSEIDYVLGPVLAKRRDDILLDYVQFSINNYSKILQNICEQNEKFAEIDSKLKILKDYQNNIIYKKY